MRRTHVRWHLVVLASVLALQASLVVVPASTTGSFSPTAHAETPGEKAKKLKDDLRRLSGAESSLRTQADAARTALVVGTAKWESAKKKLAAARKDAAAKSALAAEAQAQTETKRREVAQFAAAVYQNPVDSSFAFATDVGTGDPLGQARGMADLDQAGAQQVSTLDGFEASKIAANVFERQAKKAARKATLLEASLAEQAVALRAQAKKTTELLSRAVEKVDDMQNVIDGLEAKERKRVARIRAKQARENGYTGGGGSSGGSSHCRKSSRLNYPNGLIPQSALCALPQSGWYLRADAARKFWKLNAAYRAHFGGNICVNSAYRPLQRQYELYASMPAGYAAVPGTSNHGRGMAVDLGCGINQFGTAQHNWMRNHAGQWGFFHPAWARSGPIEPWHWEFGG